MTKALRESEGAHIYLVNLARKSVLCKIKNLPQNQRGSMSKAKIYTRFGDQGKTKLVDGSTVEKSDPRVDAYGSVDELNSSVGLAISFLKKINNTEAMVSNFEKIQHHLFRIGSLLACSDKKVAQSLPQIDQQHILFLENLIDQLSEPLPELRNFILPGGHETASQLHMCRTICRRSERKLTQIKNEVQSNCLIYLNRLSDLFFVAARWVNQKTMHPELSWNKDL